MFGNLRSEVISLQNEALEKDKIMLSLFDMLKTSEARLASLSELEQKILKFEKEKETNAKFIADLECFIYSIGIIQVRSRRYGEKA